MYNYNMLHGNQNTVGIAVSLQTGKCEFYTSGNSHTIYPQAGMITAPAPFLGSLANWLPAMFYQGLGLGRTLERCWRWEGHFSVVAAPKARLASGGQARSWYFTASVSPSSPTDGSGFLRLLISGLSGFSALLSPM